ncbi:hypothetical protein ACCQ12_01585 [Xanthomonas sp. NCPPB 1068]|uniref:hypothetical protein n=1 Tax=Xanthomonas sp. NCPPB 1068 TaxID=487525 RepID=UPI003558B00D
MSSTPLSRLFRSLAVLATLLLVVLPVLGHPRLTQAASATLGPWPVDARVLPTHVSGTGSPHHVTRVADADGEADVSTPARSGERSDQTGTEDTSTCEACQLAARALLLLAAALLYLLPAVHRRVLAWPPHPAWPMTRMRAAHPVRGPPLSAIG